MINSMITHKIKTIVFAANNNVNGQSDENGHMFNNLTTNVDRDR